MNKMFPFKNVDTPQITCVEWFFGAGGNHLGLRRVIPGMRTIAACEIEGYAAANLVSKAEGGGLDPFPVWTDCKTFPCELFVDRVSLFVASYPCPGESSAGKGLGKEDPRWLWPYCRRFIAIARPRACFFENVEGHVGRGLRDVLTDLVALGYRVENRSGEATWGLFSAAEVGASHQRKRVFIYAELADSEHISDGRRQQDGDGARSRRETDYNGEELADANSPRESQCVGDIGESGRWSCNNLPELADTESNIRRPKQQQGAEECRRPGSSGDREELADAGDTGLSDAECGMLPVQDRHQEGGATGELCLPQFPPGPESFSDWHRILLVAPQLAPALPNFNRGLGEGSRVARVLEAQPVLRRMADGMAYRVDRLRLCGNGVVPATVAKAFVTLYQRMHHEK